MLKTDLLDVALRYQRAGLSVLPIRADGSKKPALDTWKPLQKRLPTGYEIRQWFQGEEPLGLAVVAGKVSGNLAVLDVDDAQAGQAFFDALSSHHADLFYRLPCAATPSGGTHLYFRTPEPLPTQVLARDEAGNTLIEIRGEGAYAIVPPSPAAVHPDRKPYVMIRGELTDVPLLSAEEVEDLLALARSLDRKPEQHPVRVTAEVRRAGDLYNAQGDVVNLLQQHGWRLAGEGREGNLYLTRPGKERGVSASWHPQLRTLYVFTTNARPFEAGRAYSPFAVYALLEHAGDFGAAAKALAQQYGLPERNGQKPDPERLAPPVDWAGFLRPLKEVEAKPVDWLLPNLLARGEVTILAGEAGAGKTTLALEIAHALTQQEEALGERPQAQARVVWLHYDHSEGRIREKYEATYGEEPEFMTPDMKKLEEAGMLRLTPDTVRLWASMLQHFEAEVLIVDTLNDWLGCDDTDKESKVRPLMNALRQLVEETGVAVLAIHHPNKASALKRVTALANSYVFGAKADTVALLADPNGEPSATEVQLRVVKCRSGERWQATYRKHWGRFLPVQGEERPLTLQERIVHMVRTQGQCTRGQLLNAFEESRATIDRALANLVRRGRLTVTKGGYQNRESFYAVPEVTILSPAHEDHSTQNCENIENIENIEYIENIENIAPVDDLNAHLTQSTQCSHVLTQSENIATEQVVIHLPNTQNKVPQDSAVSAETNSIPDYRTAVIPLSCGVAAWCDSCGCSMLHEPTRDGQWQCVGCDTVRTFPKEALST